MRKSDTRSIYFNVQRATFAFGYNDDGGKKSTQIIITGIGAPLYAISGISVGLRVTEVANDYKYSKVKNPSEGYENDESYCYGNAILLKPDGNIIKEETLDITLKLTVEEFSNLKYTANKIFFNAEVELVVSISVIGMKIGAEPVLDKFPAETYLPVVGYEFILHSKG